MAVRGQLSGCYLLSEEEYRDLSARVMVAEGPLREAQAEALHWRAEHGRVCQALDAANVRADTAERDANAHAHAYAAAIEERDEARSEWAEYRAIFDRLIVGALERQTAPSPLPPPPGVPPPPAPRPAANYRATKLDPARRVPLHAVRPDERRE